MGDDTGQQAAPWRGLPPGSCAIPSALLIDWPGKSAGAPGRDVGQQAAPWRGLPPRPVPGGKS